jgi:transposase
VDQRAVAPDLKRALERQATLCFIDQTGISKIPTVRKTWAPSGITPILKHQGHWHRISVMGAITLSPRQKRPGLYLQYYPDRSVNRWDVIEFLRDLLRHVQRPLIVLADRGNIHRAKVVQRYLRRSKRITLEHFPAYAPDLNPIEGLWSDLKTARLANFCSESRDELLEEMKNVGRSLANEPGTLRGVNRGAGLPWRIAI